MAIAHHAIDYVEFTVTDMVAAQAFYSAAFGWTFKKYGPGYAGIRRMGGGDGEMGGLSLGEKGDGGIGGPLVVLYSEDLEQSLARVRTAGGIIQKEIFEFPGGRRFEFADPSGNALAVWTKAR
mmetsp:Transcript_28756/g.65452  ORF Transcript_28756/g.65452 Transcript_28756/m.65452 type:complete len:123 (+) Transcript_28756:142-510(+)